MEISTIEILPNGIHKETCTISNNIVHVRYFQNNKFHREDGPAVIEWYNTDVYTDAENANAENANEHTTRKTIKSEYWYYLGMYHRSDGPAVIHRYPNNKCKSIAWYQFGLRHNENGPAYVEWVLNTTSNTPATIIVEKWYINNKLHNPIRPAIKLYNEQGKIVHESFWLNGFKHRDTDKGPAHFDYNGGYEHVYCVKWYVNNLLHNTSGPACIMKDYTTKKIFYYIGGVLHRTDGPACIEYIDDLLIFNWYLLGVRCNYNNPTVLVWKYTENGKVLIKEKWHLAGKLHRENNPAVIDYIEPKHNQWFKHGKRIV